MTTQAPSIVDSAPAAARARRRSSRAHLLLALLAAIFAGGMAVPSHARQAPARFEAILDAARQELTQSRTPGAALALVEGDRVVFSGAVGLADVETIAPLTTEMLFRLGSTTKMFTAATLVTLAEEKRLPLDGPIGATVSGLDPSIARLTPRQLLSHTAGLRDDAPMFGRHDDDALGAGVRKMTAGMLFTKPEAIYSYSNPGFWIAGFVAEQLAGKPYADAVNERIFAPLGMARSTFRPTLAMTYPIAQGHELTGSGAPAVIRPAANNAATWPAGSMFSNVQDLSKFVIAFMNHGRVDGREALNPGVIAKLSSPHAAIPGGAASYGFGLELSEIGGVAIVSHGGSRAGYGSTIMMVPSRRVAAIVLGNRTGSGLPATTRRAVEMLLDLPEGALKPPSPGGAAASTERALLDAWAGRYTQGSGADIDIVLKDGALVVREGTREQPATMQGNLRLLVGANGGPQQPASWVLVPDRNGRPGYIFRGGRAYRRVRD